MRSRYSVLGYIAILILVFIWVLPIGWMILNSFRPNQEIVSGTFSSLTLTLDHYIDVLIGKHYIHYAFNSLVVAISTTIITVSVSILCAYSMARHNTGGKIYAITVLLTRAVPPAVRIIPFFIIFSLIGLTNTRLGLIIANLSFNLSLAIWLLTGFVKQIPKDIEEAARIDGCTQIQVLWKVIIPLALPGLATASILTFIYTWNEFIMAMVLANNVTSRTLPVAASLFATGYEINWGPLFAASTTIVAPVIIMTLLAQRRIIGGLTMGAVKG